MRFYSTRGNKSVSFFEAISEGLAENGGLFVPENYPDLSYMSKQTFIDYTDFSRQFLSLFFENSSITVDPNELIKDALNFPLHETQLSKDIKVLELFHGPTLSFKDFGARFLARSLNATGKQLTLLVATSGDTGSAVASSFHGLDNINVVVLFPKGKITARQKAQITCWGENVLAVEVDGVFDDCQRLVKEAFQDDWFNETMSLSTANSINIGRLLPQMTYYAYTAIEHFKKTSNPLSFIVPGGNLGNVTACCYAKKMNFPIGDITITTNSNSALATYYETGKYTPLPTIQTLANAMDVGAPSNFERLEKLFSDHDTFKGSISVFSIDDEQIRQSMIACFKEHNYIICPHTATAYYAAKHYTKGEQCIVSTAHPAKFETVIEPLLKQKIKIPEKLSYLLGLPQKHSSIKPNLTALKAVLEAKGK